MKPVKKRKVLSLKLVTWVCQTAVRVSEINPQRMMKFTTGVASQNLLFKKKRKLNSLPLGETRILSEIQSMQKR